MKTVIQTADPLLSLEAARGSRIVIVEARYYGSIADELAAGALAVLEEFGCETMRVAVPGALEIPQALALIANSDVDFDGAVVLGCVIRGETSHYDVVVSNANHWLMQVAIENEIPIGNGILTVDNEAQAMARASGGAAGKGGDAARACLRLLAIDESLPASPAV